MSNSNKNPHRGGIVHTYQKFDPANFPSPTEPPPDLVSPVFEHMLQFGSAREFTEEEIANAIKLDPGQFAGLGTSLDQMIKLLEERKQRILAKYETDSVQKKAEKNFRKMPPLQDRQASRKKPSAEPSGTNKSISWNTCGIRPSDQILASHHSCCT
jgi:hypothetical protein